MTREDSAPPGPESAPLRRQLAALVYESLLLGALILVVSFLFALPFTPPGDRPAPELRVPALGFRVLFFLSLFGSTAAYSVWFWSGGRRTLPMKTWRMALVGVDGTRVGWRSAAIRFLATWIGPLLAVGGYAALRPFGLGRWALTLLLFNFAWALFDRHRCFLHDRIAGTRLVCDTPPPPPQQARN